jgi:hypothetical protein
MKRATETDLVRTCLAYMRLLVGGLLLPLTEPPRHRTQRQETPTDRGLSPVTRVGKSGRGRTPAGRTIETGS